MGSVYTRRLSVLGCVATAALGFQAKKRFEEKYGIKLYESYGLSETLFVSTNDSSHQTDVSGVGKPLAGVDITCATDGELLIKVPWMFHGYFKSDSDQYFKDGWFPSRDIGKIDKEGFLHI